MRTRSVLFALTGTLLGAPAATQHAVAHHPPVVASPELASELNSVRAATEQFASIEAARRAGYRRFGVEGPLMGEHWYHPDLVHRPLDLAHPSTLQYATLGGRKVLVGVAYTVYHRPGEARPAGFTGEGDVWHTHDVARLARALVADRPFLRGVVERRIARGRMGAGDGRTQLTMVHAWVWSSNPDGEFAEVHRGLPYLRAGLPEEWAVGATRAAAEGIALLAPGACEAEVRRTQRLAGTDRRQSAVLREACTAAAARVRPAATDKHSANAGAERAWNQYRAVRASTLRAEQAARERAILDAGVEMHHH